MSYCTREAKGQRPRIQRCKYMFCDTAREVKKHQVKSNWRGVKTAPVVSKTEQLPYLIEASGWASLGFQRVAAQATA